MSSPASPSIWPAPREALAEQVLQSVLAAVNDSADPLARTMQDLTSAPSTSATQAFFASINPLLTQKLSKLHKYILRNVFALPPDVHPSAIASAINAHDGSANDTAALDTEIATTRARIRQCDNAIARLTAAHETAQGQATALRAVIPEPVAPHQFHTLCADIKAAEHDFVDVTNILKQHRTNAPSSNPLLQAAASAVGKPPRIPAAANDGEENTLTLRPSEEHEPLNHMPSAQGILGISMGADTDRLQDLATLRARLLG